MDKKMTDLERKVAEHVQKGEDPWEGRHGVGSRRHSGALGRLQRKGFVRYGYPDGSCEPDYLLTPAGMKYLEENKT